MTTEPQKKEGALPGTKEVAVMKKSRTPTGLAPYRPSGLWRDFDRIFERFRADFEDLLWPLETPDGPSIPDDA
jgi:hypothetical protein